MLDQFTFIWVVDFEFRAPEGQRPEPICMVARELLTGARIELWRDELAGMRGAPFDVGSESVMVAYYASAEFGCFLALGWATPVNVVDLYVEFRNLTNGITPPSGTGLLGALTYFGLHHGGALEK